MRAMSRSTQPIADMLVGAFSEHLASADPTPGGGGAAAVSASLAASLSAMVVRLSMGREKYQHHAALHSEALAASEAARTRFLGLADEDAAAYLAYRAARGLPRDTSEQLDARGAAVSATARAATAVPLAIVTLCHQQIDLMARLVGRTNINAASDLEVAALLCDSAARGAASNIRANLPSIADDGYRDAVVAELDQRLQQIQGAADRIRERIAKGGQRQPEDT
jgi:methenyltetrahydrofolate cyclohydrolase